MVRAEPFRGEVWDVDFAGFGRHRAVVVSVNALNVRLGHVAVVPVTGTSGPSQTHVTLTADAGLMKYEESYADVTSLQPVDRRDLVARLGLLSRTEMDTIARRLGIYLGL